MQLVFRRGPLAQTIPDGVGAKQFRAIGRSLSRHPWLPPLVAWAGLTAVALLWLYLTVNAIAASQLITGYESAHGSAIEALHSYPSWSAEFEVMKARAEHAWFSQYLFTSSTEQPASG